MFKTDNGFYIWAQDFKSWYGPYSTKEEATEGLKHLEQFDGKYWLPHWGQLPTEQDY